MKIYVDELPKSCWDCPCHKGDNGLCKLLQEYTDYVPKSCHLIPLSDYTKQVRKEVCDKVYEVLEQVIPHDLCWSWAVIKKELDQIQGE